MHSHMGIFFSVRTSGAKIGGSGAKIGAFKAKIGASEAKIGTSSPGLEAHIHALSLFNLRHFVKHSTNVNIEVDKNRTQSHFPIT